MQTALVEALDLVLARRAAGPLPGERRASGRGTGTELAQVRPYQVGDDVRWIDPAASARTGVPHVRDHVPERTLTTWLLVDVSSSMAFGTADRLKSDVADGVALVIGRLAVRRAGRIALLTVRHGRAAADAAPRRPPGAASSCARSLGAGVAPDGIVGATSLADGMRRIGRLARGHSLVVVVSDFREDTQATGERPDWARALAGLASRHEVLAVEVNDPREAELPDVGHLTLIDPETGQRVEADSSSKELRRRFAAAELERRDLLKSHLRRARTRHVEVATDQDWLRSLGRSLR